MTTDGAIICTECGRHNVPDAVFCATCGRSLTVARPAEPTPVAPVMPPIEPLPVVPVPPTIPVVAVDPVAAFAQPSPAAPVEAAASEPAVAPPAYPAPDVAEAPYVVACPRCGHQNEASAIYCEDCGAPVRLEAAAPLQPKPAGPPQLAGFGKRLGAYLIDTVIYVFIWFTVLTIDVAVFGEDGTVTDVIGIGSIWGVYFLYHWFASYRGRSLGMAMIKLRIVDAETGERLPHDRAPIRAFMMTLGTTLLGLGLLNALIDDKKQTWHDKAAHSVVIAE